jgi:PAS domain S-box-containing protein
MLEPGDSERTAFGSENPATTPSPISFVELLGALPDAALVTTLDGRIVAANSLLYTLAGYSDGDLVDAPVEQLVPGPLRARHVALRTGYVDGGAGIRAMSSRLDIVLRRSDGTEVPVDIALGTIPYADDLFVVATVRDASIRRRAEMSVERERAFLAAMNDVSGALLEAVDVELTLELVTTRARTLLDADLAMLLLPDRDDPDSLVVHIADGLGARELQGSTLPVDRSMSGLAMRDHEPALVADGGKDPRFFRPAGWPDDIGATLIVPLYSRGESLGSVTIAKRRGQRMFDPSDVTLMKTFAAHATLAITEARHREEMRRMRALAERERLADSIRDTVVNRLYSVGLTLHVLLQHEHTPASEDRIWSAINELDESIAAVRDAIFPR